MGVIGPHRVDPRRQAENVLGTAGADTHTPKDHVFALNASGSAKRAMCFSHRMTLSGDSRRFRDI
jgi:hypothetical protein